jgi:glutathione gamma-glutamylcysteinyltransferase
MEQFTTQSEPAYCGISTLAMVLNALSVDPRRTWKGPWRWYTESMLNCCIDLEEVKDTGITMRTFSCLANCQGLKVSDSLASAVSLAEFRHAVRLACVEDSSSPKDTVDPFLVVSYHRKILQQTGTGHFSPIAAYDEASDHVLILDTARFKYGAHWVPIPLLFEAMQPEDPDTGKSRGYILLSFRQDEMHPSMPVSILFRTSQVNHAAREKYKEFLQSQKDSPITWEQVVSYWTNDGNDLDGIWEMTEVQLTPMNEMEQDAVASVRDLIENLIPPSPLLPDFSSQCRPNVSRTVSLSPREILFVVYLASLDVERRRDLVLTANSSASQATRHQLLAEAELLQLAIDLATDLS